MGQIALCPTCAAEVDTLAFACWNCGASIAAREPGPTEPLASQPPMPPAPSASTPPAAPPPNSTKTSGTNTGRNVLIGAGVLGAIVALGAALSSPASDVAQPPVSQVSTASSATPAPEPTQSESLDLTVSWEQVKDEFADYSDAKPGTWSRPVPGGEFQGSGPLGVAVQLDDGELVLHGHADGSWRVLESTGVSGETIVGMRAEVVDTTNGGGADLLVTLDLADGTETGTVAFNFGKFASFVDSEGTYGFVSGLAMLDGDLVGGDGTTWYYLDGEAQFRGEAAVPVDSFDRAQESLEDYSDGLEGQWSEAIPGAGEMTAIAVQGTSGRVVVHAFIDDEWSELDSSTPDWTTLSDYSFNEVDTTGQGGLDILVQADDEDGARYGAVVFNTGSLATFVQGGDEYGYWQDLDWDGIQLSDPYGSTFTYLPGKATFDVD